uniref:HAT C-terminal dimerisation domain-containing protein n=1 Tax=Asparagus officinalis TaxID=4686 RepID=Q2XNZ3_ASPOF|nr:hypothetical protein 10.t00013 [Asparagus officinalis]
MSPTPTTPTATPTDVDPEFGGDDLTPRAPKRSRSDAKLLTHEAKCALCGHIFQVHHKNDINHLKRHLEKHNRAQAITSQGDIRQSLHSQSSISGSLVPSESVFSISRRLIDGNKTSLYLSTVQVVMYLQDWWRSEKRTQDIDRMTSIEDRLDELTIGDRDEE